MADLKAFEPPQVQVVSPIAGLDLAEPLDVLTRLPSGANVVRDIGKREHPLDLGGVDHPEFRLAHFGCRALESMRLEKAFRLWGVDITPQYTPFEAGVGRFVAMDKPAFVGWAFSPGGPAGARGSGAPPYPCSGRRAGVGSRRSRSNGRHPTAIADGSTPSSAATELASRSRARVSDIQSNPTIDSTPIPV